MLCVVELIAVYAEYCVFYCYAECSVFMALLNIITLCIIMVNVVATIFGQNNYPLLLFSFLTQKRSELKITGFVLTTFHILHNFRKGSISWSVCT